MQYERPAAKDEIPVTIINGRKTSRHIALLS